MMLNVVAVRIYIYIYIYCGIISKIPNLVDVISMAKDSTDSKASILSDIDNLERSILLVRDMLESISEYVARVQVCKFPLYLIVVCTYQKLCSSLVWKN